MHNPASVTMQANCFVATQAQRNADKLLKNITRNIWSKQLHD